MNHSVLRKAAILGLAAFTLAGTISPAVNAQVALETSVDNEGTPIKGGTLKIAAVAGEPFSGAFSSLVADQSTDLSVVEGYINTGLFEYDENLQIKDTGLASAKLDPENKKVTITIRKDQKWSDGQPLTIDDVIAPYYIIANKDYTGIRYGDDFKNVVGIEDYHDGNSDTISGLKKIDDYTLEISYKTFSASMKQVGGGISPYVEPKHIYDKIAIKDIADSDQVRVNPVGMGPFRVKSITPGEAIVLESNEYYFKGKPKVDGAVIEVVNPSTAVAEMKAGNYDLAELPTDAYDTFKDASNFKTIGTVENTYSYIGFKFGSWNKDKEEVEMDTSKVIQNKALRQAMAYAFDADAVGQRFFSGLRFRANTLIPSLFKSVHASDLPGFTYDPEKSKQILADAGFVDKDGDGFVEDPNGKPFTLKFLARSSSDIAEPLWSYFVESWKQVGINVELLDGRLYDFNSYSDMLRSDDQSFDVFEGAWGTGGDPNPTGFYSKKAPFNYERWADDKNEELLEALSSDKAFDEAYRKEAFHAWQAYTNEELPAIPYLYRYGIRSVNNRVKHYDVANGTSFGIEQLELTADEPIK